MLQQESKEVLVYFPSPVGQEADAGRSIWHQERITDYLQPDYIHWCLATWTKQQFLRAYNPFNPGWDILLTDDKTAEAESELIEAKVRHYPNLSIGIECDQAQPSHSSALRVFRFEKPRNIDDWLFAMHTLVSMAG